MSSAAYGFQSVKKTSRPPAEAIATSESPLSNVETFKKWITDSATKEICDVVASKDVQKEGISYLEKMFKNKQVHDALIPLLKGAIKDDRFI